MKWILLTFLFLTCQWQARAQVVMEHLGGLRQQNFLTYWQKDLDRRQKWNCFFFHQLIKDHRYEGRNSLSTEANLSYGLSNWLGFSLGLGFEGTQFTPNLGLNLSFQNRKGDFFLEAYPTLGFLSGFQPGLFGLAVYQPALNQTWSLSGQLVFAADPNFTNQQWRLGLGFRKWLQFGLGIDHTSIQSAKIQWTNPGLFVRVAL